MKKFNAIQHPFVTMSAVYKDASGAPAVVRTMGHTFACDMLGEVKLNCISDHNAGYRTVRTAASNARRLYTACLMAQVTPEWLALNAKMYRG